MMHSNSRVILLQKLLGECPSNLTPFWSSLCWDDSPLISLTRLGDGKGRAAWSLIGKTNFTPLQCFLAGTKGKTCLVTHLSTLSIFPRLEGNWYEGFVLQIEERESLGLCLHCSEVWFWEWVGEWSQINPLHICSATSGGSRDQVWWNTWCPSPRFSTALEYAGRSTAYRHRWKAWSQAHNGPENSVVPVTGFYTRETEPHSPKSPAVPNPLSDRNQQWVPGQGRSIIGNSGIIWWLRGAVSVTRSPWWIVFPLIYPFSFKVLSNSSFSQRLVSNLDCPVTNCVKGLVFFVMSLSPFSFTLWGPSYNHLLLIFLV